MDELRKAKLDLPPPPQENEFPKRPFGVFQEPNFEAKVSADRSEQFSLNSWTYRSILWWEQVGIRKSIFSNTEKEVTETVILKREQTAQEISEIQSETVAVNIGSNGHLSTGKKILLQITAIIHAFDIDSMCFRMLHVTLTQSYSYTNRK